VTLSRLAGVPRSGAPASPRRIGWPERRHGG